MKFCPSCLKCYEEACDLCGDDQSSLVESPPRGLVVAGKYRIERLISRGPNVVCEGTQIKTERPVAVKLILADAGASERVRQKALAVAHISTRVDHQHVVKTCDYGQLPGGIAYVVTELVVGRTLREHLDGDGRLAAAEAARIAQQVADGLEAAHGCGVVHGTLNPSNIILARDYHGRPDAKVINFGLSENRVQPSGGVSPAAPDEVRRYLSPEQLSGRADDARSDVYSLGVVLHEMLTGRTSCARRAAPAPESRRGERMSQQETCCEHVPEPLLALLADALNEKPSARLQSGAEFARKLRLIECPAVTAPPGAPALDPSASDRQAQVEPADLSLPPDREASVPPPPDARPPVRKIGLLDDYADDLPFSHAPPTGSRPSLIEDDPTPVVEMGVVAAPGPRQRPSHYGSRGHSERPGSPAPPAALSPGPIQTHAHRSLTFAVPTALVLALGAFGWLASQPTLPPSTNGAASQAPNSTSHLAGLRQPESGAAGGPTAQEAAGLSADDDGQRASSSDELLRPGGETRERVGSRAPEDGIINRQEIPDEGAFTSAAVRPRRVNPSPAPVGRERAGDEGCTLTTSKGTLTLQNNGDSGEVAVGLHHGPAGPAAVTAVTGDWSDIAVLAESRGAGGVSVYRIVSVSNRAGTYNVTFNSPCGAQQVVVKVE